LSGYNASLATKRKGLKIQKNNNNIYEILMENPNTGDNKKGELEKGFR